ncbi:hypothetical protein ABZP36_033515 [Zizania latifolia]
MSGRRGRRGDRRIDAAIDHFTPMGYSEADVRAVVKQLLKPTVYGTDGWKFLEEDAYSVVQEALFEKQERGKEEGEEKPQQLETAMDDAPGGKNMPILEVHNDVPAEAEPEVEDSMPIDMLAVEPILPLPSSTVTSGTRRPCYGWISESESESDNEQQPASQQHGMCVPDPQSLPCKRKRPSRWDVKPLN